TALRADVAQAQPRPIMVKRVIRVRERQDPIEPGLCALQIPTNGSDETRPQNALRIIRIEFDRLLVGVERRFWVSQGGNGAETALRGSGSQAPRFDAPLIQRDLLHLIAGKGLQRGGGPPNFSGLQQVEPLLLARVARRCALGNVRDSGADRL